jgi:hypothetical protein
MIKARAFLPQLIDKCSLSSTGLEAPPHRSSRSNMGQGGQKAQLENIERAQTQSSAKVSKLVATVAHEPLNPMAPMAINARPHASKESSDHRVQNTKATSQVIAESRTHPSARPAPLPTYQASLESSHYGFNVRVDRKSPPRSQGPSLLSSSDPPLTASHLHPRPFTVAAAARHGSIAPTLRSSAARSALTSSCSASTPTLSRSGSTAPSRGGSAIPPSRGGSVAPPSCSAPISGVLTSRGTSQVPLGSLHAQRRVRLPLTRTYLAHSLEDMVCQSRHSLDALEPPLYEPCHDVDTPGSGNEGEDLSGSQVEPPIDEVSPDEDERVAQNTLRGEPNPCK